MRLGLRFLAPNGIDSVTAALSSETYAFRTFEPLAVQYPVSDISDAFLTLHSPFGAVDTFRLAIVENSTLLESLSGYLTPSCLKILVYFYPNNSEYVLSPLSGLYDDSYVVFSGLLASPPRLHSGLVELAFVSGEIAYTKFYSQAGNFSRLASTMTDEANGVDFFNLVMKGGLDTNLLPTPNTIDDDGAVASDVNLDSKVHAVTNPRIGDTLFFGQTPKVAEGGWSPAAAILANVTSNLARVNLRSFLANIPVSQGTFFFNPNASPLGGFRYDYVYGLTDGEITAPRLAGYPRFSKKASGYVLPAMELRSDDALSLGNFYMLFGSGFTDIDSEAPLPDDNPLADAFTAFGYLTTDGELTTSSSEAGISETDALMFGYNAVTWSRLTSSAAAASTLLFNRYAPYDANRGLAYVKPTIRRQLAFVLAKESVFTILNPWLNPEVTPSCNLYPGSPVLVDADLANASPWLDDYMFKDAPLYGTPNLLVLRLSLPENTIYGTLACNVPMA